jgi:hypothetical protein
MSRRREPNGRFQSACCCHGFKVEKMQLWMSRGDVRRSGHRLSCLRDTDMHRKLQHRSDCSLLFGFRNATKWT